MADATRPRVFLEVSIGEEPVGRLVIELYSDKTPRTCENFRQLCAGEHNGLSYAKTPFHRVIDEFMVQGGDIANRDGTGVVSIYGNEFEDENLGWREMSLAGLVCTANRGKDTNGSQFFILLEPQPDLNGKHTIFGRVVSGEDVLSRMAGVAVDEQDRPCTPVLVSRCGELERKRKRKPEARGEAMQVSESGDRGRRPRSNGSDSEMSNAPQPPRQARRSRRQSDNIVDEGIRGRPRNRSKARSTSQAIEEDSQSSARDSPVKIHKRKRSPSPSRHNNKPGDVQQVQSKDGDRRRRSLPNQYRDDGDRYRPSPRRDDYTHRRGAGAQFSRRENDRLRQRDRESPRLDGGIREDGRLGGYDDEYDPPVKFKGRGAMKYREPDRF